MPSAFINFNGRLLPAENPVATAASRAFRYGYGLFETLLLENGSLPLAGLHWDRLFAGMETLLLEPPARFDGSFLEKEILRTAAKNGLAQQARIRLQVMPGDGGYYDRDGWKTNFVIECFPLPEDFGQLNENGLITGMAGGVQKAMDRLANLKTCSALPYALAARQALANRWNDAFVCNTAGRIADSTIANVFWVQDGVIFTPPLSEGCVAGVLRRHLLQNVLPASGIPFGEQPLEPEALLKADEVFLTNALRKIRWVRRAGDREYGCDIAAKLHKLL